MDTHLGLRECAAKGRGDLSRRHTGFGAGLTWVCVLARPLLGGHARCSLSPEKWGQRHARLAGPLWEPHTIAHEALGSCFSRENQAGICLLLPRCGGLEWLPWTPVSRQRPRPACCSVAGAATLSDRVFGLSETRGLQRKTRAPLPAAWPAQPHPVLSLQGWAGQPLGELPGYESVTGPALFSGD